MQVRAFCLSVCGDSFHHDFNLLNKIKIFAGKKKKKQKKKSKKTLRFLPSCKTLSPDSFETVSVKSHSLIIFTCVKT